MKKPLASLALAVPQALRRAQLLALARIDPARCETLAIDLFASPIRPRPPISPDPPGLPGRRFSVLARFAASGDIDVALTAWAWGEGPTVLLSHGWNGHAGHLTAFIAPLVAAGFRAVAFDHLGHGVSEGARSNMLEFRNGVLTMARALTRDGTRLHAIIGHSLGATATVLALDRGLGAHCAGPLALIAPPLDPAWFSQPFGRALGLPEARLSGMLARLHAFVRADLGARDVLAVAREQHRRAFVLHDRDDRAVRFAEGEALAAALPGARLLATSGLGHRRILSDPAVVAEVIAFVTGAGATSASSSSR